MKYTVDLAMNLQDVLDKAKPGDLIQLQAGSYTKPIVLTTSGTEGAPITVEGLGEVLVTTPNLPNWRTNGQSWWTFRHLRSSGSQSAFEIDKGSTHIAIDGLITDTNRFAIRITEGSVIRVTRAFADHSKNAVRIVAGHHIEFSDCEAYRSLDIWEGANPDYKNGDGWIAELPVHHLTLRRINTSHHADGGLDIKASDVLIEDVVAWGCKSNFKIWGQRVVLKNCLGYGARREVRPNGTTVEGHGLTCEKAAEVTAERCTFVDNQHYDLRQYEDSVLRLVQCVIAREMPDGSLYGSAQGKPLVSEGCVWFDSRASKRPEYVAAWDLYAEPGFVNRVDYRRTVDGAGWAGVQPPVDVVGTWDNAPTPPIEPPPVEPPPVVVPPTVPPGSYVVELVRTGASTSTLKYGDKKKIKLELPTTALPSKPARVSLTVAPRA